MLRRLRRAVGSAFISVGVRILWPEVELESNLVKLAPVPPVVKHVGPVGLTEAALRMVVREGDRQAPPKEEEREEVLTGSLRAQGRR